MSVSIFTPKAFSIRSAISPERSALPFSMLDSGPGNPKSGRRRRYRQTRGLDNFCPNEIAGMGRVLHRQFAFTPFVLMVVFPI